MTDCVAVVLGLSGTKGEMDASPSTSAYQCSTSPSAKWRPLLRKQIFLSVCLLIVFCTKTVGSQIFFKRVITK